MKKCWRLLFNLTSEWHRTLKKRNTQKCNHTWILNEFFAFLCDVSEVAFRALDALKLLETRLNLSSSYDSPNFPFLSIHIIIFMFLNCKIRLHDIKDILFFTKKSKVYSCHSLLFAGSIFMLGAKTYNPLCLV